MISFVKTTILGLAAACTLSAFAAVPVSVRWEMGSNDTPKGYYTSKFIIKNVSGEALGSDWSMYFNQFSRALTLPAGCPVDIKEVSTGYYRVTPNAQWKNIKSGDSLVVDMTMKGTLVNICYVPQGGHWVKGGDTAHPQPLKIHIAELAKPGQWLNRDDYPDGKFLFAHNAKINTAQAVDKVKAFTPFDILPSPKKVELTAGAPLVKVPNLVSFKMPGALKTRKMDFKRIREYATAELQRLGIYVTSGCDFEVELKLDRKLSDIEGYYTLRVDTAGITITGASDIAVFNGVKTLVAVLYQTPRHELPTAVVTDYPDLHYRGIMLDIARNFLPLDDMKRVLDAMAFYKFNTLQLHFTDDEAWRIEIQGLPELTEVASRRGCTNGDEHEFLAQVFDGNGNPNDLKQSANGYYTRGQFIELLKYAHSRGITVIPEIETPGHARAAIVAMKARHDKLIATSPEKARQYMLWDPDDQSSYSSVQAYKNNVLNVAQDGVYNFLRTVVLDLEKMYSRAGLKLEAVHLGGDEVASKAWDGSPAIKALMQREALHSTQEVSEYFMQRLSDFITGKRGIKINGWQEVVLNHSVAYTNTMRERLGGVNAWQTVGKNTGVPGQLTSLRVPTILSCAEHCYLDFSYNWHQYEPGLHWGGAVDEFATWSLQPWSTGGISSPEQRSHVIGVQGQLFSETLRGYGTVQYYLLPKMLGLAERGWNATATISDSERAIYNIKIGTRELPALRKHGYKFRIAQPGIKLESGKLVANAPYPGMEIRYTTDGTEPDAASQMWTKPVAVAKAKVIKAKAYYLGLESKTTYLFVK